MKPLFGHILRWLKRQGPESKNYEVITQQWDQFESDWGRTIGGYSIHLTEADLMSFIAEQEEKNKNSPTYFIADSFPVVRYVDKKTYEKTKAARNGIWWPDASLPVEWGRKQTRVSSADAQP